MNIMTTSLSGMYAAVTKMTASANNTANAQSTRGSNGGGAYVPQDVIQQESASGGVITQIAARQPAFTPIYDPEDAEADSDGIVQNPNVDEGDEMISQKESVYGFQANLAVMRTNDKMQQSLLDIYA